MHDPQARHELSVDGKCGMVESINLRFHTISLLVQNIRASKLESVWFLGRPVW